MVLLGVDDAWYLAEQLERLGDVKLQRMLEYGDYVGNERILGHC